MLELAEELARLKAELAALRTQGTGGASLLSEGDASADERPPHY